jgi:2,3-bisphosphoglycerate-independent phosphoglycerate mutase
MKYIIILADGVADRPMQRLGGRTPLMVAAKPNIDALCAISRCGRLVTVPDDMPPGSEIANMAVLGYDVRKVYQGRGVLEAASIGVPVEDDDLVMRCNLICIEDGNIKNHSAGHISTEEARELITALNETLSTRYVRFHPGVSYRHVLTVAHGLNTIRCTPPHDVPGTAFRDVLVKPSGDDAAMAEFLNSLILMSQEILRDHPVNRRRIEQGKDSANSIWPWSPGHRPAMRTLQESYGIKGAVISAVDLLYGIGVYAGMTPIKVEGSTGLYDTNYEGKARAAVDALREHDLVYLHIEASDEAGHEGNADLKIRTIESLDQRVVRAIMHDTAAMTEPVAIALLPDHPTPCELRTHVHDPVPFMIHHPGTPPDGIDTYDERSVESGSYGLLAGDEFIRALLQRR